MGTRIKDVLPSAPGADFFPCCTPKSASSKFCIQIPAPVSRVIRCDAIPRVELLRSTAAGKRFRPMTFSTRRYLP